jgi:hypothetical protein
MEKEALALHQVLGLNDSRCLPPKPQPLTILHFPPVFRADLFFGNLKSLILLPRFPRFQAKTIFPAPDRIPCEQDYWPCHLTCENSYSVNFFYIKTGSLYGMIFDPGLTIMLY